MTLTAFLHEKLRPRSTLPQPSVSDLEETECSVCLEPWHSPDPERSADSGEHPLRLSCGHVFGHKCIMRWYFPHFLLDRKGFRCPACARLIPDSEFEIPLATWRLRVLPFIAVVLVIWIAVTAVMLTCHSVWKPAKWLLFNREFDFWAYQEWFFNWRIQAPWWWGSTVVTLILVVWAEISGAAEEMRRDLRQG